MNRSHLSMHKGGRMLLKVVGLSLSLALLGACGNDAGKSTSQQAKAPAVAGGYQATLAEGIQFGDKPGYPQFVASVSGMSGFEPGNRWTEGPVATFTFVQPLPKSFALELEMTGAFGPNVGKPVAVTVGDWRGEFTLEAKPKTVELKVETAAPARTIAFGVPAPASPRDLGVGSDTRQVGVGFKRLRIVAN